MKPKYGVLHSGKLWRYFKQHFHLINYFPGNLSKSSNIGGTFHLSDTLPKTSCSGDAYYSDYLSAHKCIGKLNFTFSIYQFCKFRIISENKNFLNQLMAFTSHSIKSEKCGKFKLLLRFQIYGWSIYPRFQLSIHLLLTFLPFPFFSGLKTKIEIN